MPDARQFIEIQGTIALRRGTLADATIAYETWGQLNIAKDNAVLLFTGLSPSAHAASSNSDPSSGWWEDMIGPEKPIDTTRYFVVCVNSLGSCFGSTGPASIDPTTMEPYRLTFPVLCLEDVAFAGQQVVERLGIEQLHAVVGPSMGGMTALAHTLMFPGVTRQLVSISSATHSLPFSVALRSLQREMIRKDPLWQGGKYDIDVPPSQGMQLARKLGMITYRSAQEWTTRFGRERATDDTHPEDGDPFGITFEVESYLEAHAKKFVGAFDANCYLYLSRAMDLFDTADHGGSIASAFQRLVLDRVLVIGVQSDFLFPAHQQEELASAFEAKNIPTEYVLLSSIQGHDSFLVDMDRFRPVIAEFF